MGRIDGVGVAFCGGGFRAFAEVAAQEDMEKHKIPIGAVAGTSMGALVAALVAAGLPSERVAELLIELDKMVVDQQVLKVGLRNVASIIGTHGMIDSNTLEPLAMHILDEVGIHTFADFKLPIAICAVDVVGGDLFIFTNDAELFKSEEENSWHVICNDQLDAAKCVMCSASYPLVISPTTYVGHTFIDGGCRMNLPTPLFDRSQVDAVVGVGMIRKSRSIKDMQPLTIAQQTINIGANQLDRIYAQIADIYINLPVLGDDAFQAGTGKEVIEQARQMIADHPIDWSVAQPSTWTAMRRAAIDTLSKIVRRTQG